MLAELPDLPWATYVRPWTSAWQHIAAILLTFRRWRKAFDPEINLAHVEAGHFETKVELLQSQLLQLFGEQSVVPGRVLRQAIVGNDEGLPLGLTEVIHADGGYLVQAEYLGRQEPAMPGDYPAARVDQQRHDEAESLYAARDLIDLCRTMNAGISRIEL
jgi:hypothetical protein